MKGLSSWQQRGRRPDPSRKLSLPRFPHALATKDHASLDTMGARLCLNRLLPRSAGSASTASSAGLALSAAGDGTGPPAGAGARWKAAGAGCSGGSRRWALSLGFPALASAPRPVTRAPDRPLPGTMGTALPRPAEDLGARDGAARGPSRAGRS